MCPNVIIARNLVDVGGANALLAPYLCFLLLAVCVYFLCGHLCGHLPWAVAPENFLVHVLLHHPPIHACLKTLLECHIVLR